MSLTYLLGALITTALLPPVSGICQTGGSVARFFSFGSSWTDNGFSLTQGKNTTSCVAYRWPNSTSSSDSLFGLSNGLFYNNLEASGNNFAAGSNQQQVGAAGGYNYLTKLAQNSSILTYDLAVGGTTVDHTILSAGGSTYDFATQVQQFVRSFNQTRECANAELISWNSTNTVFVIFVGDNDILQGALQNGMVDSAMSTFNSVTARYQQLVSNLYNAGARRFMYVTTPSQEYSDAVVKSTSSKLNSTTYLSWKWKYDDTIRKFWNSTVPQSLPLSQVYTYNMSTFMSAMWNNSNNSAYTINSAFLDSVNGSPSGFKLPYNVQNCTDYNRPGTRPCIWANNFHATYQVHGLMAQQMYAGLHKTFNFGTG